MNTLSPDRLLLLTVGEYQTDDLIKELSRDNFHFTIIDSHSGVFPDPIICLLIGFNQEQQNRLLDLIRLHCRAYRKYIPALGPLPGEFASNSMLEAQFGGALVQVVNVERFEQI